MSAPTERTPSDRPLLLAFVLSGAAALGYELLWTRLLALTLGHETLGVYGTLAGFFAGMAVGAAVLHRRAATGPFPLRLFATLEISAAIFAAVSPDLLRLLAAGLPPLLGPLAGDNQSSGSLVLSLVIATIVLLPGTFCLGATLPALVAVHHKARPADGAPRGLGRLYAANTLGATLGVLGTLFLLLPALGYRLGAIALAGLGFGAAALALRWGRRIGLGDAPAPAPAVDAAPPRTATIDTRRDPDPDLLKERWPLYALTFATGLVGVGLEVVGLQILGQRLENTVYTFADVLAVYLVGTAIGAAIYQRLAHRATGGRPATVLAWMLLALAGSVVVAALGLGAAPAILGALAPTGASLGQAVVGELAVAAAVFLVPTALMGALFSHVIGLLAEAERSKGVGLAYALNTLGSALAPFLFGLGAIPNYGYSDSLYLVAYAYLALYVGFCWVRRFPTKWLLGGVLAVVVATALGPRSLVLIDEELGWSVVERRETLHGVVTVSEQARPAGAPADAAPLRRLQIGEHFRMGGARSFGERRMGHLPLLIAPDPSRALFLGVGAGATVGAAADFDAATVAEVEAIELVPEVLQLLHHFDAINNRLYADPRFRLRAADARRAIAARPTTPEAALPLIVGDLFHPGRDGAGSLYTAEHFAAIAERLAPRGIYVQWLPLHQLDAASLGAIVRTFLAVFTDAHAFLGIYNAQTPALALVGARPGERLTIDVDALSRRLRAPNLTIVDARDLLAAYMLDRAALEALAGDGALNRDLAPEVVFTAPRAAYAGEAGLGADTLARVLELRVAAPAELLVGDPAAVAALVERSASYRLALDYYLRGEIGRARARAERPRPEDMPPYLAAYAADPSFPPARGLLYAAAAADPEIGTLAFPAMLQATPDEPRVYQAFLQHLQRVGDRETFAKVLAEAQRRFEPAAATATATPGAEPATGPASATATPSTEPATGPASATATPSTEPAPAEAEPAAAAPDAGATAD
ncbi:MAG: fused MFS/spermidine synthase [Nannocystaceae bacterium]